ncbi:hypothetical protein V22_31370 [Calycomorphotria hydatis]|uniref:Uncharacterized protein n=1 Tax=Calycomorphotria hydatis TaxID=2528027 RepID=A0A517TBW4_9PLAN|nr:hypothetical protein V22_31370 [Calycomorphotria hydatis]
MQTDSTEKFNYLPMQGLQITIQILSETACDTTEMTGPYGFLVLSYKEFDC